MEVRGGIRPQPRVALLMACVGMMAGMRHGGWHVAHDCLHGHDMDLWAVFAMFCRSDVCDYTIALWGLRLSPCCRSLLWHWCWDQHLLLAGHNYCHKVTGRRMFYDRSYVDECQSSNITSVINKTATLNFMTLVVTSHCLIGQLHTLCPN